MTEVPDQGNEPPQDDQPRGSGTGGRVKRGRDDRRASASAKQRADTGRHREDKRAGAPDTPVRRSLSGDAPPPRGVRAPSKPEVPKPSLPRERPQLSGSVFRDIRRTARKLEVDEVATAVGVAGQAMEEGDLDRALELLIWAGSRAPRSTAIREGLGVAYYLSGRFEDAQRELQAYRRMSGQADQNHLLADSARALGHQEKVIELVDEMTEAAQAGKVPVDRLIEALIVQASMRAEGGDFEGALATLEGAPLPEVFGEPHSRLWYAAGDIAERMGDKSRAREYFESVLSFEEDFLDTDERVARLST